MHTETINNAMNGEKTTVQEMLLIPIIRRINKAMNIMKDRDTRHPVPMFFLSIVNPFQKSHLDNFGKVLIS